MAREQQAVEQPEGRHEGSRWIHQPPAPGELAKWFRENVKIDPALDHKDYFPGITIIPNKEWVDTYVDGEIKRLPRLVFTPYPKVETREMYFWDWCDAHGYTGEVAQVPATPSKYLPAGFFQMPVKDLGGREVPFIGVSYQVKIWEPNLRSGGKGREVRIPAAGTKIVPLMKTKFNGQVIVDEDAIHKAQTGAQGRALGFAGMLIVPGAGIATAEDMQEFLASEAQGAPVVPPPAVEPAPPAIAPPAAGAELGGLIAEHIARLQSDFPTAYEEAEAWAREKGYDITDPPDTALRGLERALRQKLEREQSKQPA